jgi:ankyrin repeat protein
MSFGISLSDIFVLLKLAKDTVQNCRYAPNDFAEASRVSQSLYLMLEGVKTEYQNPDPPLLKDDRTRTDFAIHFKNCETSLKPLADLLTKHKRLTTSNIRVIDRMRFPKKDYLEYRGNLAFYTARLSEFLQMVGLGSLGRIEQKVEEIKGHLPNLMNKLDQMCAEFRIMGDKESLLSDHTDDEKFVWKTFRSKLNKAGFTINVLREHEAAIFLRIRELTECGLLDTDGSSLPWKECESSSPPSPVYQMPSSSQTMMATVESDADSEKSITSKPSVENLRLRKSTDSMRSSRSGTLDPIHPKQEGNLRTELVSRGSSPAHGDVRHDCLPPDNLGGCLGKPRIWRNTKGEAILKGSFFDRYFIDGHLHITVLDTDKQEVLIPLSNLSEADLAFVDTATERVPKDMQRVRAQNENLLPKYAASPKKAKEVNDLKVEPVELPRRTHPAILVGKRTRSKMIWAFRQEGSDLPQVPPYCSRSLLTSDLLPTAASSGDLKRVKRLLASGEHIESKGPQSWTEAIRESDGNGGTRTRTKRHSYPETTALYRAAYAGWLDVVHFLISEGADADARNGYDGRTGEPILFSVIRNGHEKMAKLLLEYGAKMEAFGSTTALHVASSQPKRSLVRLVLDYGAHIDAKDHLSQTPLYLASSGGFASIVELLLEEGARTNRITSEGRSALYKAGGNGRGDIVELLLGYGADPAVGRGRYGETTIYKAAWYDDLETVELLLNYEADINIRNKKKMESYKGVGEKIFHGFVAGLSKEHAIMNTWGKTALHAAAYRDHEEMLQALLLAGADLEAAGNDGHTALYLAAQQKHQGIVQMLLKAGAQLETEKHDPVLALLNERNKRRDGESKQIAKRDDQRREMAKMGTSDVLVGLVADWTKALSSSRRLHDRREEKRT